MKVESTKEMYEKIYSKEGVVLTPDCVNTLRAIKLKKNLGSEISSISNLNNNNYTISYANGDNCTAEGLTYSSSVTYVCNPNIEQLGWP